MPVKYAIREMLIRRHRTAVNCIGIAVAIALVISLYSLSAAYKAAARKPFEASGVDLALERPKAQNNGGTRTSGVILPDSATVITGEELARLSQIDGIEAITASIQAWSFDSGKFKVIAGIDPDSPAIGPAMFVNWVSEGNFFRSGESGVAVVEKHYANSYGIKTGGSVEISGESFLITGKVAVKEGSQLAAPNFFLPIEDVRRLTGLEKNAVNAVYIRLQQASDTKNITDKISGAIPGIKVSSPDSSLSVADSLFSLSERFIWLISIVIVAVAVFLIFKTVTSSISERIREIGIMKAVGWTSGNIRGQLTLETLIQAAAGGVLGVITGTLLSFASSAFKINAPLPWQGSPIPGSAGMAVSNSEQVALQVSISPLFIFEVFIAALLIALLCSITASRQANKINPAESMRKL